MTNDISATLKNSDWLIDWLIEYSPDNSKIQYGGRETGSCYSWNAIVCDVCSDHSKC